MDPNENIKEQRRLAARIIKRCEEGDGHSVGDDAERLAELVQALDEWMASGGFHPASWVRT